MKTQDKDLGRKILKIEGNVSNANYIKFPGRNAKQNTLGLIGNYVNYKNNFIGLFLNLSSNRKLVWVQYHVLDWE